MSEKKFSIDSILICDYATQDRNGKLIMVGVQEPRVGFPFPPPALQPLAIILVISPHTPEFEVVIEFLGPGGLAIVRGNFKMQFSSEIPEKYRVNITFNVPSLPFPGFGTYSVVVREGADRVVATRSYDFLLQENAAPISYELSGTAEINPQFLAAVGSNNEVKAPSR